MCTPSGSSLLIDKHLSYISPSQPPSLSSPLKDRLALQIEKIEIPLVTTPKILSPRKKSYGNKYEGLIKIDALLKKESIVGVEVPLPKGISHKQIESFLMMMAPEVFKNWESLTVYFEKEQKERESLIEISEFLSKKEIKGLLRDIKAKIQDAFATSEKKIREDFFNKEMSLWLETIRKNETYLMVRSSGDEDSEKFANAGGNLSVSYVNPEHSSILKACGDVVASYFSRSSLKKRFEAGINPFEKPLSLSVLLQELIGENIDVRTPTEVPVSVVLFTDEPNYSEKGFRITKISCSYGHGEGIVKSSGVACDTIYALQSIVDPTEILEVYQNKEKAFRLAPKRNDSGISNPVTLKLVENSSIMTSTRCLSKQMVKRLYDLAFVIEKNSGCPMDMEIVIKGETIFIVQARPIIRPKATPTYLSDETIKKISSDSTNPIIQTKFAKVLVSGKGCVEKIKSSEEVLVCDSLKEAERLFKKNKHKIVIVGNDETSNSHPIVNFSGIGMVCYYYPHLKEIRDLIKLLDSKKNIISCPQSGRICIWDTTVPQEMCINEGYFSHPADITLSIDPTKHLPPIVDKEQTSGMSSEIQDAIRALKMATTQKSAFSALETLKIFLLNTSIEFKEKDLLEKLKGIVSVPSQVLGAIETIERIKYYVSRTFTELEASYKESRPRLERLFHIKTLSELFTGKGCGSLNTYSLMHIGSLIKASNKILSYQNKLLEPAQLESLLYVSEYFINPVNEEVWEKFLSDLEKAIQGKKILKSDVEDFKNLLTTLTKNKTLPKWVHCVFLPSVNHFKDSTLVLQELIGDFKIDKEKLDVLCEARKELGSINDILPHFGDPKLYKNCWKVLSEFSHFIGGKEFLRLFLESKQLSKSIAVELMREYVEVFDAAVKTMKGSFRYAEEDKLLNMQNMLIDNYKVLKIWIDTLPIGDIRFFGHGMMVKNYFVTIEKTWDSFDPTNLKLLLPSQHFSVQAACLSSKAKFDRHLPQTLEDIFTLTHQNQLFVLSRLERDSLSALITENLNPPPVLTKIIQSVSKLSLDKTSSSTFSLFKSTTPIECIGVDFTKKGISVAYNMSLRSHSAGVQLDYDKFSQQIIMRVKLFGEARDRWQVISNLIQVYDYVGLLKIQEFSGFTKQEIIFSWVLQETSIQVAVEELEMILLYSISPIGILDTFFRRAKEKGLLLKMGEYFYQNQIVDWGGEALLEYLKTEEGPKAFEAIAKSFGITDDNEQLIREINFLRVLLKLIPSISWACKSNVLEDSLLRLCESYIKKIEYPSGIANILRFLKGKQIDPIVYDYVKSISTSMDESAINAGCDLTVFLIKNGENKSKLKEILE